ncbi:hypothetical protein IWW36_000007 [Coemansia brasiliensis]|uniref:Uncharacterized protein n=1 Tax=Coemansia brasiliensis TaxID=2650707 RepID=A0A9W8IBR8_9FUNG|nr:hypothetical protein IWW36_000007 [Coemansia brasiliensis]
MYKTIFARRESLESQRQFEWAMKEADRKHHEHVHDLKHRRHTESRLWIPSRLRKGSRSSEDSNISELDCKPTTIRWSE